MSYLLDNDRLPAGDRFVAMASLFDPVTTGHLDGLGIGPGWRCWEVGAGGTSMVHWLAGRTGRAGYVLATDIDTTVVAAATGPTVIVLRHDLGVDPCPAVASTWCTHAWCWPTCRTVPGPSTRWSTR